MSKHLTLSERKEIEVLLKEAKSFKEIGRNIGKDCTTISKEIRYHLVERKSGAWGQAYNACALRFGCKKSLLCKNQDCSTKKCSICPACNNFCDSFVEEKCKKLDKSPYVCYNYVDAGLVTACNIDLPRKVKYRPRKKTGLIHKVDRKCRIGRTYDDFHNFMEENNYPLLVQMDSVIGRKGGKVLLTLHFVKAEFMLAFLRDTNDSQSVIDVFDSLNELLGIDMFKSLFPVCLGDNGSEFSNPIAIECDRTTGEIRTNVFYCDPCASFQKGAAEKNHEEIRKVLPQGTSFDNLTQKNISLMMDHINSYSRPILNDKTPYDTFKFLFGEETIKKLGSTLIPPNEICLKPSLLKI